MNKRGFTLIELLAVIVILAVIALIATPIILGIINDTKKSAFKDSVYGISQSAKNAFVEIMYAGGTPKDVMFTYTDGVETSNPSGYTLKYNGDKPDNGKILLTKEGKVSLVLYDDKWCATKTITEAEVTITDDSWDACSDNAEVVIGPMAAFDYNDAKGVNKPKLATGMTPIKWNGTTWVETTKSDPEWYNYGTTASTRMWANAKTADGSYWVWIPRYIYKISTGWHTSTVGTIDIQFSQGTVDNWNSAVIGDIDTGTGADASNNKWTNHPAFKFGTNELTGIWVAKFEMSGSANAIDSKPNVSSIRNIPINDMFTYSKNMETNSRYGWETTGKGIDTHMTSNTEWGAMAYLTQSTYGTNSEVWINNSGTYTTGCAGNSASEAEYAGCQNAYNTTNGVKASSTGTINGIYDISGGSWEYTASYLNNDNVKLLLYGSSVYNADFRYRDAYSIGASDTSTLNYGATSSKKGDAIYETSNTPDGSGTSSWGGEYSYMFATNNLFMVRGGRAANGAPAGVFGFNSDSGRPVVYTSWRTTLIVLNEAPVITMTGDRTTYVTTGSAYNDSGATAIDPEEGNVASSMETANSVNVNVPGTYTVTYTAGDSRGNISTAARTVIVGEFKDGPNYVSSEGVNGPSLATGMIPVKWNGVIWVFTNKMDANWYDYPTKKWANVVTAEGSMWVWVPRYAYQISTNYHTNNVGNVNVKFLQNTTDTASDSSTVATAPTYSGATQTNYIRHPAFVFGGTQVTGMWVAKFEPSVPTDSACYTTASTANCNTTSLTPLFIPNVASWRYISVATAFSVTRGMETNAKYGWGTSGNNIDTHMMKNIDWGMISFLAQSTYGINNRVWKNPSNTFITGCTSTSANVNDQAGCPYSYETTNGVNSSSTGTIYGIYDTHGNTTEFMMANYNNTVGSGGIDPTTINSKYIEIYTGTAFTADRYGDAVYEISQSAMINCSSSGSYVGTWNGNTAATACAAYPWITRGADYSAGGGVITSSYTYRYTTGAAYAKDTFRPVIMIGSGL